MSGTVNFIRNLGLTNNKSEDYGDWVKGVKNSEKREYAHWCTSHNCTHYTKPNNKIDKKTGEIIYGVTNHNRAKTFKFTKEIQVSTCPDCGHALIIK